MNKEQRQLFVIAVVLIAVSFSVLGFLAGKTYEARKTEKDFKPIINAVEKAAWAGEDSIAVETVWDSLFASKKGGER